MELAYLAAYTVMLVDLNICATTKVVAVELRVVPVASSLIPITQTTVAWLNVSGLNSVQTRFMSRPGRSRDSFK